MFKPSPPANVKQIEELISKLDSPPSEGLESLWLRADPASFPEAIMMYEPGTIKTFKKNDKCGDFDGFDKLIGRRAYAVMELFPEGAFLRIPIYEMIDGDHRGKLVAFQFFERAVYYSNSSVYDVIDVLLDIDCEDGEDIQGMFNLLFHRD